MLRWRTLVNSYSASSNVFIQDVEGVLWETNEWDGSATPNGIAVITEECEFVIALNDLGNYAISGIDLLSNLRLPMLDSYDSINDYDGYNNTVIMIEDYETNAFAANACYSFRFPNGNHGYLGAYGEWWKVHEYKDEINDALLKAGGVELNSDMYWSSTRVTPPPIGYENQDYFTGYYNSAGAGFVTSAGSAETVRPFCTVDKPSCRAEWFKKSGTWNYVVDDGYVIWSCESPGDNGSAVIRCEFEGCTSITFMCAYWGENNYDYLTVGKIDTPCSRSSYGTSLKGTTGKWKSITFNCDKSSHYVEFCYSKDSSVSENGDYASVYILNVEY